MILSSLFRGYGEEASPQGFSPEETKTLAEAIEDKIREHKERIEFLERTRDETSKDVLNLKWSDLRRAMGIFY